MNYNLKLSLSFAGLFLLNCVVQASWLPKLDMSEETHLAEENDKSGDSWEKEWIMDIRKDTGSF